MVNVNPTDKLVFDLEMFQIDFNKTRSFNNNCLKNILQQKVLKM